MKIFTIMIIGVFVFAGNSLFVSAETSAEVEVRAETNVSEERREGDTDSDGDGLGDVEEREVEVRDIDSDGDGIPTATPTREIDKATPARVQTRVESDDQTTPLLYQGLRVRGELCARTNDCDDDETDVRPEAGENNVWIRVSGDEVRAMNEEEKVRVQERLRTMAEVRTAQDFGLRVANAALENEAITEIITSDDETEVRFRTRLSLFGFIPMTANAVARANTEGEVTVRYPWYRFLSRVQDDVVMTDLAFNLRTSHNALILTQ